MVSFTSSLYSTMYRKIIQYKRSWCGLLVMFLATVILSVFTIVITLLNKLTEDETKIELFSNVNNYDNVSIYQILNSSNPQIRHYQNLFIDQLKAQWKKEKGNRPLKNGTVQSYENMTSFLNENKMNFHSDSNIIFSFYFYEKEIRNNYYGDSVEYYTYIDKDAQGNIVGNLTVNIDLNDSYYSSTESNYLAYFFSEAAGKIFKNDTVDIKIRTKNLDSTFSISSDLDQILGPLFISIGISIICAFFIGFNINDIKTPIRPYIVNCGLSLSAYWLGNFIIDYIIMALASVVAYTIYYISNVAFVTKYASLALFFFVYLPIPTILFTYVLSWVFTTKAIGTTIYTVLVIILSVAGFVLQLIVILKYPQYIKLFYAIEGALPPLAYYNGFTLLANNIVKGLPQRELSLKILLKDRYYKVSILLMFLSTPIYAFILLVIEYLRIKISAKLSEFGYELYENEFKDIKSQQRIQVEAKQMEDEVAAANSSTYAVRISNVSKLFKDGNGNPLCAVNQVSLGIKKGELFGFLGANGAGKTTLMKMILRELPISNGTIEINSQNITEGFDSTQLSIVPQFDDHLTPELTPYEQLKFFAILYDIPSSEREKTIDTLVSKVLLEEHKDKLIQELSGGNQRKTSVAVAFLSNSKIVLLDEPTSSLDPVARKAVHSLINEYRGDTTFMLCTHLLDEAESLCDNISIMLKGCVFVVGSPQYLSAKFGTEWKVDITLNDIEPSTQQACDEFFRIRVPKAEISIKRPNARIYSIPASAYKYNEIFKLFQEAKDNHFGGIKYYTCSMSTLEKVFLEIVMLSEKTASNEEVEQSKQNNDDSEI